MLKVSCNDTTYHVNTNSPAVFTFKSRRTRHNGSCDDTDGTSNAFYFGLSQVSLPFSTPIKLPYRFEQVDSGVTQKAKVVVVPLGD